jgi:hypothetical protein
MAATSDFQTLIVRVQNEFLEMPGLRLNVSQAMRLWGLERDECQRLLDALVSASFLQQTRRGEFIRG